MNGSSGLRTLDGSVLGPVKESWLVGRAGGEIPWLGAVKLMVSGTGLDWNMFQAHRSCTCLHASVAFLSSRWLLIHDSPHLPTSPDHIQAQQEKAFLVALGVDEEE